MTFFPLKKLPIFFTNLAVHFYTVVGLYALYRRAVSLFEVQPPRRDFSCWVRIRISWFNPDPDPPWIFQSIPVCTPILVLAKLLLLNLIFSYISQKNPISSKLLIKKKFNTVLNLITIFIVFTNKNGMDRVNPPIKTKVITINVRLI